MLRVGIIGCGRISDLHALGYRNRDDADIVALCDVDRTNAASKAAQWELPNAEIFDDYRKLCQSGLVDLVEIIVPHHLHCELAAFAVGCDLHVSPQKPLSLSLADADRLLNAAAGSSKVVRLYENFLFYPPILKALELIEQGLIGEPLSVRLKSNAGYSPNAWDIPLSAQQPRRVPAAGRWCSTTATTNSRWPGSCWGSRRRCTPGSDPPSCSRASSTLRRWCQCATSPERLPASRSCTRRNC